MYKTRDTPNSATLPDDALIEIETAAGKAEHIVAALITAEIDVAVAAAQAQIDAATRYTVIEKTVPFTPLKTDGAKPYYRAVEFHVSIGNPVDGGFSAGDEVVINAATDSATNLPQILIVGTTINTPPGFKAEFAGPRSTLALIAVSDTEWDMVGDLLAE